MRNIVIADAGFLIALFDASDALHDSAKESLKTLDRHGGVWLKTVWPVIVEICFFLRQFGLLG